MLDFLIIATRNDEKKGFVYIYPKFIIKSSKDLMIRGGDFYAVWDESSQRWSTNEQDLISLIDAELNAYAEEHENEFRLTPVVQHMWDAETGMIDRWHKYCQKQSRDNYHQLDERLIFSNEEVHKDDYATKTLPYPLVDEKTESYDKLMSTLYDEPERHKLEWSIGSIVAGESKNVQKFVVLYGSAGTGKSTVLNIIQQLFEGYYSVFDAKALGSSTNVFALEAFKTNPLVAIQHDGDLSKIEDNTRLNSLVSHELMTVNEKYKSTYENRFNAFLFMGTNKPVKITDSKSGLMRRLIDVQPSGRKLPSREYFTATRHIKFELGGIAKHCLEVYKADPDYYDSYTPIAMMDASNDFYNFMLDSSLVFKNDDETTLKVAWEMYKAFCDDANIQYPMNKRAFKEELKSYFRDYAERGITKGGTRVRSYFSGFRTDKFGKLFENGSEKIPDVKIPEITFKETASIFDEKYADAPAQYAKDEGTPKFKWDSVKTKLRDLDTTKLHYVRVPANHIVIDFDIPGSNGEKSLEANIEAASKWPKTYAELSKSGKGVHLHYIYTGDPEKLSRIYDDHIEIKVFTGKSSLRRKLTKCNTSEIAQISSGLPLKGADKVVNFETIKDERRLRTLIKRSLNYEIHPNTKPNIDFIKKVLDEAYSAGFAYDVSDMRNAVLAFAASSTHQSAKCIDIVADMHFKSEESSKGGKDNPDSPLVFFDCEVFPNLFLVNWKVEGDGKPVARMINPSPFEIEQLFSYKLVGFNNRRYDNHILYARMLGYSNEQLYKLSTRLVSDKVTNFGCFFDEAYNISYTDVYDFAAKKQSLKKWEIELGIHHKELGLPWDQPVPEDQWLKVAEYCDNDVIATEAVFHHLKPDFEGRQLLAEITGLTVNDTTNTLTRQLIFGNDRHPQDEFVYTDLSKIFPGYKFDPHKPKKEQSTYRGRTVGEGGRVYAEPGMYSDVALLDVQSMHPASIVALNLFGDKYTARFRELRDARIAVKHKDAAVLKSIFGGAFANYVGASDEELNRLAFALKIAINSVYGLTSANFSNAFKDPRNIDNIVAKRGALFMINLEDEVKARGYTVAHIKTDSIKIPNATPEIIQFVMDYGKQYGYIFEHEATYSRMCLVNDAVYIARYKGGKHDGEWTATGAQFQIPYVFKTLFSHEPLIFDDFCETKSVKTAIYLDMNEGLTQTPALEKELKERTKKNIADHQTEDDIGDYHIYANPEFADMNYEQLKEAVAKEHNYIFVGRVGRFTPIKKGCGGGLLMRDDGHGGYSSVTGTKGYRWLESETVQVLNKDDDIDKSYYTKLTDAAIEEISKYGDFEWFVSED